MKRKKQYIIQSRNIYLRKAIYKSKNQYINKVTKSYSGEFSFPRGNLKVPRLRKLPV